MEQTEEPKATIMRLHADARTAIKAGAPVRALDLLDEPFMRGMTLTRAQHRENSVLEERARTLDGKLNAPVAG